MLQIKMWIFTLVLREVITAMLTRLMERAALWLMPIILTIIWVSKLKQTYTITQKVKSLRSIRLPEEHDINFSPEQRETT